MPLHEDTQRLIRKVEELSGRMAPRNRGRWPGSDGDDQYRTGTCRPIFSATGPILVPSIT